MKPVVRLISNQRGTNKGLPVNGANIKGIIGYQPGRSINARSVNSGLLYEVVLYYMVLNYPIAIGILA